MSSEMSEMAKNLGFLGGGNAQSIRDYEIYWACRSSWRI
jgi:hypothetical protein